MSDQPKPTDISAPAGRNVHFYAGWSAHECGHDFEPRAVVDWRWGWREREKLVRVLIREEVNKAQADGYL